MTEATKTKIKNNGSSTELFLSSLLFLLTMATRGEHDDETFLLEFQ